MDENINSIHNDFKVLNSNFEINVNDSCKDIITDETNSICYDDIFSLKEKIEKLIPVQLNNNNKIKNALNQLITVMISESKDFNINFARTSKAKNLFIDIIYIEYLTESDTALKRKSKLSKMLQSELMYRAGDYKKRSKVIKAIFSMQKDFQVKYVNDFTVDGSSKNKFRFTKELLIENPIEYLYRCFNEHIHSNKFSKYDVFEEKNINKMIECFITGVDDIYKEKSSCELLYQDILAFDLNYQSSSNIYYLEGGQYKNIEKLSPGARTNILMEYIVYRETERPLLIDQPEDNIDNQTIYEELKKWFYDLKFKRQVIVVTHDANIVINSDAENIIIASQKDQEEFMYSYGAMEYSNNLEEASKILDGGYEAVERRMKKYGARKSENH